MVGKPLTYTPKGLVDFQLETPIYSVGTAMTPSYIEILVNAESEKTYLLYQILSGVQLRWRGRGTEASSREKNGEGVLTC